MDDIKIFSFQKKDHKTGLTVKFFKAQAQRRKFFFFRIPFWEKEEEFIGRWKNSEEGFPSLEEIEKILHGRW